MIKIPTFDYLQQFSTLQNEILESIERVINSGQLILGDEVNKFEESFINFLGEKDSGFSVGVNSGTDALVVSLMSCGVGLGDEVITVSNTAVPTVSAIRMVGAKPVFCDVDESTALINLNKITRCISPKTKAIVIVHLFGNVVDIDYLREILPNKRISIIEDCAQAHGGSINGKKAGALGDVSAFSFYPTKNLGAYGDAGLCFTRDEYLASEMKKIRMYGFDNACYSEREGINSRMDELQAAILNVKLPYLKQNIERRRELASYYNELLNPNIRCLKVPQGVKHAYHLYVICVKDRDRVRVLLSEQGVSSGTHYPYPIHLMKAYEFLGYRDGDLPITESLSKEVLSLPMYPELSKKSVEQVCEVLNNIVE